MKVSAAEKAVAIVAVGTLMPDAPNAPKFWQNIREGVYSIKDVIPRAGIPICITTPIQKPRIKPIPKSEDGCATGSGIH